MKVKQKIISSALAQMKEAQTGLEMREAYESEDSIINPAQFAEGFDVANQMETSSYTTISFASDETEKQVIFKILDDGESEGQEMINFIL